MAKNNVAEWSATAADNTDIAGTGILGSDRVLNFDNAFRELMAQIAAAKLVLGGIVQELDAAQRLRASLNMGTRDVLLAEYTAADLVGLTVLNFDIPTSYQILRIDMFGIQSVVSGTIDLRFGTTAGGAVASGATDYITNSLQAISGSDPTSYFAATSSMSIGFMFAGQYGHQCVTIDKGRGDTAANMTTIVNSLAPSLDFIAIRGGRRQALGIQNRIAILFSQALAESGSIKIYGQTPAA